MKLFSIPNLLTCLNLTCGVLAIVFFLKGQKEIAPILICISLAADFLDGFTARLLKISSPIGKELDSLADVVTFGVFPSIVMMYLLAATYPYPKGDFDEWGDIPGLAFWAIIWIAPFSALRLAKFNLDERQSDCFYGLNTPANTIFILSLWLVHHFCPQYIPERNGIAFWTLFALSPILAFLLISELKLLAFKFKNFTWQDNKWRFMVLIVAIPLIAILGWLGIPLAVISYIIISIIAYSPIGRENS